MLQTADHACISMSACCTAVADIKLSLRHFHKPAYIAKQQSYALSVLHTLQRVLPVTMLHA